MPDFIAPGQMVKDAVIHMAMGVAYEPDAHGRKLATDVRFAPSWRFR